MADEALQNHKHELEKRKAVAGTWVADADLPPWGVKVPASSRDPATVKGIQHKKCSAKRLREQYHYKKNRLAKLDEAWRRGEWVEKAAYWKLKTEVDNLAEESDAASWKKGQPFTDSNGDRQLEKVFEEASIVARAVDMYRRRRERS